MHQYLRGIRNTYATWLVAGVVARRRGGVRAAAAAAAAGVAGTGAAPHHACLLGTPAEDASPICCTVCITCGEPVRWPLLWGPDGGSAAPPSRCADPAGHLECEPCFWNRQRGDDGVAGELSCSHPGCVAVSTTPVPRGCLAALCPRVLGLGGTSPVAAPLADRMRRKADSQARCAALPVNKDDGSSGYSTANARGGGDNAGSACDGGGGVGGGGGGGGAGGGNAGAGGRDGTGASNAGSVNPLAKKKPKSQRAKTTPPLLQNEGKKKSKGKRSVGGSRPSKSARRFRGLDRGDTAGVDLGWCQRQRRDELLKAAGIDDVHRICRLFEAGADPDGRNECGETALMVASRHGCVHSFNQLTGLTSAPVTHSLTHSLARSLMHVRMHALNADSITH